MSIEVRSIIGVVGKGDFEGIYADFEAIAEEIGEQIALKNCRLLCGGLAGMMEAASRGAKKVGGMTIGILPNAIDELNDENKDTHWPNPYIDLAIFTGLGGGIRKLEKETGCYIRGRNFVIVNSCDAIIALPGSNKDKSGTRSEINGAIERHVPVVLHSWWKSETIPNPPQESELLVQYYDSAKEAVEKAIRAIEFPERTMKLTTVRRGL